MADSRFMGVAECAAHLGFGDSPRGRNRVYQWVARGHLPYAKVGRTLRFDKQKVDRMMERRTRERR